MAVGGSTTPVRYDLAQYAVVTAVLSATQFVANALAAFPDGTFATYSVWVLSKANGTITAPKTEAPKLISNFLGSGAVSPILPGTVTHNAFTAPLAVGDSILLLNPSIAAAFGTPTPPVTPTPGGITSYGSVVANWQTAERDLLTIGVVTAGTATTFNFLGVGIQNLAGNITIRMYCTINGTERQFYPVPAATTFAAAVDAPCIPVINGTMIIPGRLRVTVQSDNAADNGLAVTYEVA